MTKGQRISISIVDPSGTPWWERKVSFLLSWAMTILIANRPDRLQLFKERLIDAGLASLIVTIRKEDAP